MAFFLVDRDKIEGSLRLLSADAFATREDALAALPGLLDLGDSPRDVFVCDLDAAMPVLFMPQPVDVPVPVAIEVEAVVDVATEPAAGVWEAPVVEEVEEIDLVSDESDQQDLADALRRAAISLEAEGIVAPEPTPSASQLEDLPVDLPVVESAGVEDAPDEDGSTFDDELATAIASLGVEMPVEVVSEEPVLPETAPSEWPWENVEPVEESAVGASAEDDLLAPEAPESEEFVPRPVIMGDYGDVPAEQPSITEVEPVTTPEEMQTPPESELGTQSVTMEDVSIAEELAAVETAPAAYEPGDLELEEYTCDDCIYANTCPKAGASSPSECGSFQWKSI